MKSPRTYSLLLGLFGVLVLVSLASLGQKTFRQTQNVPVTASPQVLRDARGGGDETVPPTEIQNNTSASTSVSPVANSPIPSLTTGAIAGKVFSNSSLGISFRYPDSWEISEEKKPEAPRFLHVSIGSIEQAGSPGVDMFINDLGRSFENYSDIVSEQERTIAGVAASETVADDTSSGRRATFIKFVSPKGDNYLIAFSHGQAADYSKELASIAATWKFE